MWHKPYRVLLFKLLKGCKKSPDSTVYRSLKNDFSSERWLAGVIDKYWSTIALIQGYSPLPDSAFSVPPSVSAWKTSTFVMSWMSFDLEIRQRTQSNPTLPSKRPNKWSLESTCFSTNTIRLNRSSKISSSKSPQHHLLGVSSSPSLSILNS